LLVWISRTVLWGCQWAVLAGMRRVLLTVHKFLPAHKAGTEVLTGAVARELKARGYQVLVLTADPPDLDACRSRASGAATDEYVWEGVPVRVMGEKLRLAGYTFACEYNHPGLRPYYEALLAEFKPDIVHVFHAQNLSGAIMEAAYASRVPVVCSATDFWFVCPIVQLKRPCGSICRGPATPAVNCLTCYTPRLFPAGEEFVQALFAKYPALERLTARSPAREWLLGGLYAAYKASKLPAAAAATLLRPRWLRQVANRTQAIMVPTRLMREVFVANGIRGDLIHHVPFGMDTSIFEPYKTKSPSEVLRIGFIGTLFEHKGADLLVEAFQALPAGCRAVLKIYGDIEQFPEYAARLLALARRDLPNSDRIEFAGVFPNARLGEVLAGIDVLVVPSRWYENTPLVVQSALATRTPLVATNLGGLSELIVHEHNGLLFELNNVNSLQEQLLRLLNESDLLARLAANIAPERTIAAMVDDIESIYNRVVGSPDTAAAVSG
jgi:glycosyltransferase involved in cell wall biosynthesis